MSSWSLPRSRSGHRRRAALHSLVVGFAVTVAATVCPPAGATPATVTGTATTPHTIVTSSTNLATFIGSATDDGFAGASPSSQLLSSYTEFAETISHPSPALELSVRGFFHNGGIGAWVLVTPDETASTLTSAMDGWSGSQDPQRSDLWSVPALGGFSGENYDSVVTALVSLAVRNQGIAVLEPPRAMIDTVIADDDVSSLVALADHLRAMLPAGQPERVAFYATSFPDAGLDPDVPAGTATPVAGVLAGVIATSDIDRGVWSAPGGVQASLVGVASVPFQPTNAQMGQLNAAGLIPVVTMAPYGPIVWGARTLAGAVGSGSAFSYLSVRRLTDLVEHSTSPSLRWAVFEPNTPTLWAEIATEVRAFMGGLYATGALSGSTLAAGFQVTCDATTTSADDVLTGVVNVTIEFQPVTSAELIDVNIQVDAGTPG